jgi:hypothetical protein
MKEHYSNQTVNTLAGQDQNHFSVDCVNDESGESSIFLRDKLLTSWAWLIHCQIGICIRCCQPFVARFSETYTLNWILGVAVLFSNRTCLLGSLGSDLMTCPRWDTLRFNHMEEGAVKLVKQQL